MILKCDSYSSGRKLAITCKISKYSIDKAIVYYNTNLVFATMKKEYRI